MPIAFVTGHVTPYNRRLFEAFVDLTGEDLHVFSCTGTEPHRTWIVGEPRNFKLQVLPGYRKHLSDISHIYVNPSVVTHLVKLRPKIVAVAAFSPTMALAWAYAKATGTPFGIATDGVLSTDPGERSRAHRWMRQLMVPGSRFGICASEESVDLLARWGLDRSRSTVVPLVPPWDPPARLPTYEERPYDVLFAGTLNENIKGAGFFTEVVGRMLQRRRGLKIRVTGHGPLRGEMEARLASLGADVHFDGAVQPDEIAACYASAKLLLFPSRGDVWGLVANEAVQCGTPVLGSNLATSSRCYVERFGVGLMRPLDVDVWADAALEMLETRQGWSRYMDRRGEAIGWASIGRAAGGLKRAFDLGSGRELPSPAKGHALVR